MVRDSGVAAASGDIIGHNMGTRGDIAEDHLAALIAMAKEVSRAELVGEAYQLRLRAEWDDR